jgi:hypothetical protein
MSADVRRCPQLQATMRTIDSRIRRLQERLCPDNGQPQRLWVLLKAGYGLARSYHCVDNLLGNPVALNRRFSQQPNPAQKVLETSIRA